MAKTLDQLAKERSRGKHLAEFGGASLPEFGSTGTGNGAVAVGGRKKSSGGLLSHIPGEHIVGATLSDLYHAAVNTPAGLYYLGEGLATHPVTTVKHVGESTLQDFEHPLRHPGYTLLDLLGAAGGAAGIAGRVGATASALERGATAGEIARAALTRATPAARELRVGDLTVKVPASKAPIARVAQKATDKALQAAAEKNPAGVAAHLLNKRVGRAITEQGRVHEAIAKGPGAALVALGRKLTDGENKALQVVAEQAPLNERITAASARVVGAKDTAARSRHQAELDLLHQAQPHLTTRDGKPALTDAKLQKTYDKMATVAGDRETLLKSLGMLSDEAIASRTAKAARIAIGQPAEHPVEHPPEIPGQLSLIDEPKPDLFTPDQNAIRIPDVARKAPKSSRKPPQVGSAGTIGRPRAPGSVTHEYTGALREQGLRRQDTAQLVGESGIEAGKFAALQHIVDMAKQAAGPVPTRADDLAVRLDKVGPNDRMPLAVRRFLDDPHDFFQHATATEKGQAFEQLRQRLLIDPKKLTGDAAAEFEQLHKQGKIAFVPRTLLGDFAKPQAPLSAVAGSRAVRSVDAINNASRFAILYLKPAYAIPNLLGNAALNVIQQGFAAPANLARAVALTWRLGPELTARIDTLMGEGFARAVSAHGQGVLSTAVDKAASVWSKGVDSPFRRSSFIHEARAAGYRTPAQFEKLLTDPAETDKLTEITTRANREIIDYAALSPAEREIVRRVVFFYPWVKGSTRYAAHMVAEHPVGTAAQGQIGKEGRQRTQADLGPVPSYLEGIFPVGNDKVSNPASAAILQTPAQVGAALAGIANGNVSEAAQLSNFASPALSLALSEIARRNLSTGAAYPGKTSGGEIARDVLGNNLPQVTLLRNIETALSGKSSRKLYPPTVRSAIEQFLLGSIAPRKINRSRLRALAIQELEQQQRAR